jgi:hypothetical protein
MQQMQVYYRGSGGKKSMSTVEMLVRKEEGGGRVIAGYFAAISYAKKVWAGRIRADREKRCGFEIMVGYSNVEVGRWKIYHSFNKNKRCVEVFY